MIKTVFIVDDSDTNLATAEEALEDRYRVMTVPSAAKMFTLLEKITPDLILLDIEMPEINGFETLKILKSNEAYSNIPVIFLTAYTDNAIEVLGFELGAVDFISKPFSTPVLLNRIKTRLHTDEIIRERTAQVRQLQNGIISVLAEMVESRDKATDGHIERTTAYMKILLKAMEDRGVYSSELSKWNIETAVSAARLHDIGKIVVSAEILNKNSVLNGEEFEYIKSHTAEGERIIDKMAERTGEDEFLHNAKLFAGYHHEHWDGTGYIRGLKGTEIPLQGRIMAVIDVYDALVSERSYKEPLDDNEVVKIIKEESGKHFDPEIVKIFLEVKDLFREIALCLMPSSKTI